VADGVLSDVYEPTIDNTDVSTLQYVVTDGATFTDLQARDMTYTVAADPTGMACTVTSTDTRHGFRLVTTYITDPASDTVLMDTRLRALPGSGVNLARLHLYARLDAHVNGNGGGGSANAQHGQGRDVVPLRPPAASRRGHAAQLAPERQGRPGHRRHPAGGGRLPDPDGLPGRARR
jgi:glucoamylase